MYLTFIIIIIIHESNGWVLLPLPLYAKVYIELCCC
jgi:hypothetical protein